MPDSNYVPESNSVVCSTFEVPLADKDLIGQAARHESYACAGLPCNG